MSTLYRKKVMGRGMVWVSERVKVTCQENTSKASNDATCWVPL